MCKHAARDTNSFREPRRLRAMSSGGPATPEERGDKASDGERSYGGSKKAVTGR